MLVLVLRSLQLPGETQKWSLDTANAGKTSSVYPTLTFFLKEKCVYEMLLDRVSEQVTPFLAVEL